MSKTLSMCVGGVGSHKMHIFTVNIPTFHSRYERKVLITNEFHEFCWSTISGISDDRKTSYRQKSMHIFNMSKIRHSHNEYDTRGWCGTKPKPNWAKVGRTGPTSLAGPSGVGAFSNSTLPMCQGRSVHGVSNAQSRCGHKTWPPDHPSRLGGLTSGPPEPHFRPKHRLNPIINTPILLLTESAKKVRFSFL
jgi:hypothetical protein